MISGGWTEKSTGESGATTLRENIHQEQLKIMEDCIVFLNERIYISALYRRHKCAVQGKCSTSTSMLYK